MIYDHSIIVSSLTQGNSAGKLWVTVNGNLYHVTKSELSPVLLFSIWVVPRYVRSIRIVLDSFYLVCSFWRNFSTWIWCLPREKTALEKLWLHSGADPGFFLVGGALVSCSTSTPMNHIVFFFGKMPNVLENCRSSQGGGGVCTPCTLPLDPPLNKLPNVSWWILCIKKRLLQSLISDALWTPCMFEKYYLA